MLLAREQFEGQPLTRSRRPAWLVYGIVAAVIVVLGIAAFAIFGGAKRPAAAPPSAASLTVTSVQPRRVTWTQTLATSGAVAPWQEAIIGSQIGGYQLADVKVNVGDMVQKGQVLAQFDRAMLEADAAQLQANYDQALANEKRYLALEKADAIAAQSVLQAVTTARVTQAQLASKKLQLRYTDVVAPDSGTISARIATQGAVVPVGQELFRLIRQNRLEWRGELTASQIARISAGQRIALSLPDGTSAVAKVRQVAPSLDGQSRLGTVYADIEPGSHARAGMYADGKVALESSSALVVPSQSVVVRDGRNYVFKLTDDSATPRLHQQLVTPGRRQGDEVEILAGVSQSDRLVAAGAGFLSDNDIVRLAKP